MAKNERRTSPRNYSEDLMEFFSFRHKPSPDSQLSFGYDSKVISYYFLNRRSQPADEEGSLFESSSIFSKVRFTRHDRVMSSLVATARALYGLDESSRIRIDQVDQHMRSSTNPFRVIATINGEEKMFYIKQPSVKRAVGKAFYNLLVPSKAIAYRFNEHGFAVDSVPGKEIEDEDRDKLVSQTQFVEELVRLNVFTNLMLLDDILKETNSNCSYSRNSGIHLFDFDRCFTEGDYLVMSRFRNIREKVHVHSIEEEARYRLFRKLWDNSSKIEALLRVVSHDLPEYQLAYSRGAEDLGSLLRKELDKLGNWQRSQQ